MCIEWSFVDYRDPIEPADEESTEVSDELAKRREAVCGAILRYLAEHPRASDTAAGICAWWLPAKGVNEGPELVEGVLEALVAEGRIRPTEVPGGARVYGSLESRDMGT